MSIEMPEGTPLKEHQKWSNQHGYIATDAEACNKPSLQAAYKATDVKELLPWLRKQSEAGVAVPIYPTAVAWLKGKKESTGTTSTKARPSSASSRTGLNLEQEFEAQYAAERDQKLLAFLEAKVQELSAQLKIAQGAVRDQKIKMGLIDPPIAD